MKVLHKNGFSPAEFDRFKNVIHDNVITSMRQILDFADKHDLTPKKLQVSDNHAKLGILFEIDQRSNSNLSFVLFKLYPFAITLCTHIYVIHISCLFY